MNTGNTSGQDKGKPPDTRRGRNGVAVDAVDAVVGVVAVIAVVAIVAVVAVAVAVAARLFVAALGFAAQATGPSSTGSVDTSSGANWNANHAERASEPKQPENQSNPTKPDETRRNPKRTRTTKQPRLENGC